MERCMFKAYAFFNIVQKRCLFIPAWEREMMHMRGTHERFTSHCSDNHMIDCIGLFRKDVETIRITHPFYLLFQSSSDKIN